MKWKAVVATRRRKSTETFKVVKTAEVVKTVETVAGSFTRSQVKASLRIYVKNGLSKNIFEKMLKWNCLVTISFASSWAKSWIRAKLAVDIFKTWRTAVETLAVGFWPKFSTQTKKLLMFWDYSWGWCFFPFKKHFDIWTIQEKLQVLLSLIFYTWGSHLILTCVNLKTISCHNHSHLMSRLEPPNTMHQTTGWTTEPQVFLKNQSVMRRPK